jgi:hypothetical protein
MATSKGWKPIMHITAKILISLGALGAVATSGTTAFAATAWARHHPRQREVLARERNQIARINRERREGEITASQAKALRASDRSIAAQDHADARANRGYITHAQQQQLNAEENAQSRAIGR